MKFVSFSQTIFGLYDSTKMQLWNILKWMKSSTSLSCWFHFMFIQDKNCIHFKTYLESNFIIYALFIKTYFGNNSCFPLYLEAYFDSAPIIVCFEISKV